MKFAFLVCFIGTCIALFAWVLALPFTPEIKVPLISEADFPKLVLSALGGAWAFWGGVQCFRLGSSKFGKLVALLVMMLGMGASGGMFAFMLWYSKSLPAPAEVNPGKPVAEFTLPDKNGRDFALASLNGKRVVLIFGRGFW